MKILYVEDNDDNIYMLKNRLARAGFTVVVATNGAQGIAMATSEQPGLILMELTLPDMDGKEATRRIKSEPITQRIPIIALTENAMSSDREKAIAACSRPVMTSTPAGRSRRPQPQPRYWSRAGQPFAPRKLRAAAREVQRRTLAPPCDFQSN
jgi:CheY-like chemotaxis protein